VANVTASRVSLKSLRKIRIFQPDAYFSIDFANRIVSIHRKEPAPQEGVFPRIVEEKFSPPEHDSLQVEIEAFVNSVLTHTPPLVTGLDGLKALVVAQEIRKQIGE
ncbi:MAG: gfo/Idh/MocA family oxidoreductase, partial [Desulfobacterota bacterium]|nr:gfo/Idh/MocA family oxidoreductase [Thermodesulfobacteriota bacterium]